jgi:hypothetical protein
MLIVLPAVIELGDATIRADEAATVAGAIVLTTASRPATTALATMARRAREPATFERRARALLRR